MAKRSSLRASDADRDRVVDRLRQAAAEGRILAHELEERMATALRARTYGELDAVVDDLPGGPTLAVERKRSTALQLAFRHPLGALVVVGIGALAVAMVVATVAAVALSGLWLIPLIAFIVFRNGGGRRRPAYRHYQRGGQMHRYGRS